MTEEEEETRVTIAKLALRMEEAAGLASTVPHPSFQQAHHLIRIIHRALNRRDKGDVALLDSMLAQAENFLCMREAIESIRDEGK